LRKTGKSPSSHNSRFNILKERFREVYEILDKDFPFYQGSYVQSMTKELLKKRVPLFEAGFLIGELSSLVKKGKVKLKSNIIMQIFINYLALQYICHKR